MISSAVIFVLVMLVLYFHMAFLLHQKATSQSKAWQWRDWMRTHDKMPPGVTIKPFKHVFGRDELPPGDYPAVSTVYGDQLLRDGDWVITDQKGRVRVYPAVVKSKEVRA